MEDRFRKPQTAAGSEPKSRKTKKRLPPAKKTLVSKSDLGRPLPKASNSSRIRAQVPQNRNRKNCRNVAYKTHSKEKDKKRLPPAKKTLVSKSDLGRPLPKASNSSRIRAQVTQNRNRKNCRNVAYKTHSKERDKKRLPPAKKTLVSKSDLGRPLVTSPLEAIKNNALPMRKGCAAAGQNAVRQNVTQNAVRQNAFRYLRSRLQHQQASKLWISSRILCNNFLGALPLTPKEGSAASKLWISSRILCNNFLGALPLTPKEGSADSFCILSIFFPYSCRTPSVFLPYSLCILSIFF